MQLTKGKILFSQVFSVLTQDSQDSVSESIKSVIQKTSELKRTIYQDCKISKI